LGVKLASISSQQLIGCERKHIFFCFFPTIPTNIYILGKITVMAMTRIGLFGRTLLTALLNVLLSAAIFLWLTPMLAPTLSVISRPADSFPWWAPALVKLFESVLLSTTTLSNGIGHSRLE
jgi:hypothetical protein